MRSPRCDAVWSWSLLLGIALTCPAAVAQVRLDRLTACDDVASIYRTMASSQSTGRGCRGPQTSLDALLVRKLRNSSRLCFESWSQPMLRDFSCFFDSTYPNALLTCMRPARLADVRAYKAANDKELGAAGAAYGTQAQQCPIYRGDIGPAQPTLISPLLATIAKLEFGFIASLGAGKPQGGYVVHGFASIDPSLSYEADALEFVSFSVGGTLLDPDSQREAIGQYWWLSVNTDEDFDAAYAARFRGSRLAARIDTTTFQVQQRYGVKGKPSLQAAIEELFNDIVAGLRMEGFEPVDLSGEAADRVGAFDPAHLMEQAIPYGFRPQLANPPRLTAMNRPDPGICRAGRAGGYMAIVMASSDHHEGAIILMFAALGQCPRLARRAQPYIGQLGKDAEILVRKHLSDD